MVFDFLRRIPEKSLEPGVGPDAKSMAMEHDRTRNAAARQFASLAASPRASMDVKTIVAAAARGQVELLFISVDDACWGRFSPAAGGARVHVMQHPGDEDLLRVAARLASQSGATVYAVARELMPVNAPICATIKTTAAA